MPNYLDLQHIAILSNCFFQLYIIICRFNCTFIMRGKRGAMDRASDSEYMNDSRPGFVQSSPTGAKIFVTLLVPLSKALYSNCSVVRRSRKAVGPVYMYLNINTSVHVKERHRLFVKSRGSSRYC